MNGKTEKMGDLFGWQRLKSLFPLLTLHCPFLMSGMAFAVKENGSKGEQCPHVGTHLSLLAYLCCCWTLHKMWHACGAPCFDGNIQIKDYFFHTGIDGLTSAHYMILLPSLPSSCFTFLSRLTIWLIQLQARFQGYKPQ